jgi:glycosyltransferase involved in cell wall biosynthesis
MLESHVSILPSEYETFGKSALESLATWLPTIVFSDVPAFQEYMTHDVNGILVERDSGMKNLFENFLRLIESHDLYTSISRWWIESGWQYGWNVLFHKMEQDITLKISQVCL